MIKSIFIWVGGVATIASLLHIGNSTCALPPPVGMAFLVADFHECIIHTFGARGYQRLFLVNAAAIISHSLTCIIYYIDLLVNTLYMNIRFHLCDVYWEAKYIVIMSLKLVNWTKVLFNRYRCIRNINELVLAIVNLKIWEMCLEKSWLAFFRHGFYLCFWYLHTLCWKSRGDVTFSGAWHPFN